jgi:hypothetical protein
MKHAFTAIENIISLVSPDWQICHNRETENCSSFTGEYVITEKVAAGWRRGKPRANLKKHFYESLLGSSSDGAEDNTRAILEQQLHMSGS